MSYSIHELKLVFIFVSCHLFVRQLYRSFKDCLLKPHASSFVIKDRGWKLFISEVVGLESIPLILLKTDSSTEVFLHGFHKIALFKISDYFLQDIFANSFLTKLQGSSNLKVAALMKTGPFDKNI